MGGYRKKTEPELMNKFTDNVNCIIENNMIKETRQSKHFNDVISPNESRIIKIGNMPYLDEYDSTIVTIKIIEVSNDDSSVKTNFIPATVNLMICRANGKNMISKGNLINALDGSEITTFKIIGFDYYPNNQALSITLKNSDTKSNRYKKRSI